MSKSPITVETETEVDEWCRTPRRLGIEVDP